MSKRASSKYVYADPLSHEPQAKQLSDALQTRGYDRGTSRKSREVEEVTELPFLKVDVTASGCVAPWREGQAGGEESP